MAEQRKETNTLVADIILAGQQLIESAKKLYNLPIVQSDTEGAYIATTKKHEAVLYGFHCIQKLLRQRMHPKPIGYAGIDEEGILYIIEYDPTAHPDLQYHAYLSTDFKELYGIEISSKGKINKNGETIYHLLEDVRWAEQSVEIHIPDDPKKESTVVWKKNFGSPECIKKIYSLLL